MPAKTKKPASDQILRKHRLNVLGYQTARCERCLADCSAHGGEWAIDGLCTGCRSKPKRTG